MMADDDQFDSDTSDDDYVPSGGEGVSEEEHSGEEEDLTLLANDGGEADVANAGKGKRRTKKKKKDATAPRLRQGGIKLDADDTSADPAVNGADTEPDDYNKQLVQQIQKEQEEKKQVEEKKKSDSLWDDFLKDVGGPKPKPKPVSSGLGTLCAAVKPKQSASSSSASSHSPSPATSTSTSATSATATSSSTPSATCPAAPCVSASSRGGSSKVTITTEYDFAGETVKITKEVDASSKEAKQELKKKEQEEAQSKPTSIRPTAGPSLAAMGLKRPGGGLGSVLGKIAKKPKMGTLEKSKLDWNQFKKEEGIEEELQIHNKGKDGYIERQQFLQRTDVRQFEREKDLRLKNHKRLFNV